MNTNNVQKSGFAFLSTLRQFCQRRPELAALAVALTVLLGAYTVPRVTAWYHGRRVDDETSTPTKEEPVEVPATEEETTVEAMGVTTLFKARRRKRFEKIDQVREKKIPVPSTAYTESATYGTKANVLAHVAGHQVAGETSLEGSTHKEILTYIADYLEKRLKEKHSDKVARLLEEIKGAKALAEIDELDAFKSAVQEQVKTLQTAKKPLLIPFGWTNHAMYLEILHESNWFGTPRCTVRVFNLGAGSYYHPHADHKRMPVVEWKGVEISRFASDPFLQVIFELDRKKETPERYPTYYSAQDIYISCKKLLAPTSETQSQHDIPFNKWMAPQEIGNCAWKSLAAFFSIYLEAEYGPLMADLKIDTTYQFAVDNCNVKTAHSQTFLEQTFAATAAYVEKQVQQGHIDPAYRSRAVQRLTEAKKVWAAGREQNVEMSYPQKYHISYRDIDGSDFYFSHLSKPVTSTATRNTLNPLSQKSVETLESIRAVMTEPLMSKRLEKLVAFFNAHPTLWKEEGLAIHQGLFELLRALPLERNQWKEGISKEKARELLICTQTIGQITFSSWYCISGNTVVQPEQLYILKKLLAFQSVLNEIAFNWPDGDLFNFYVPSYDGPLSAWDTPVDGNLANAIRNIQPNEGWPSNNIYEDVFQELPKQRFWEILKKEYPEYVKSLEKRYFLTDPKLVLEALSDSALPAPLQASRTVRALLSVSVNSFRLKTNTDLSAISNASHFAPKISCKTCKYIFDWHDALIDIEGFEKDASANLLRLGGTIETEPYNALENDYLEGGREWSKYLRETLVQTKRFPQAKLKRWTTEEVRLLLRVFASKETVHNDLLAYCKEHPDVIFEADFQRLFLRLLFRGEPGPQIFHLQHWLKEELGNLIRNRSDELETACFFLRAIRTIHWISSSDHTMPRDHFDQLQAMKKRAEGTSLIRLVFLEELAYLSKKKDLTDSDLLTIAKEVCVLNQYPLNSNDIDPLWLFEITKANLRVAKPLTQFIDHDPSRINQIRKVLDKDAKALTWTRNTDGTFTAKETGDHFCPASARFDFKNAESQETFISPKIIEESTSQLLFPTVIKGRLIEVEGIHCYEFNDPATNRPTRVTLDGKISQKIEDAWWLWTPAENLYVYSTFILSSGRLTFSYHHFRLPSGKEFITEDPVTHEILYRASIHDDKLILYDTRTTWTLSSPSSLFKPLAHKSTIEEWYSITGQSNWRNREELLKKCSLPTLGLHFRKAEERYSEAENRHYPAEERLNCEELPGFYLNLTKPWQQIIPHCPFGIVLENEKGERKFLLPQLEEIKRPNGRKESLIPHFEITSSLEEARPGEEKYHLYDLSETGVLSTKSMAAELYLASIYFLFKEYEKAFEILKKQRGHLLPFDESPALLKPLQRIIELGDIVGDQTPHAHALSVFASLLLLKNALHYPRPKPSLIVDQKKLSALSASYRQFLKKGHHIIAVSLLKEEELFLIEHLDPKGTNALFQQRKALLMGKSFKIQQPRVAQEPPLKQKAETIDYEKILRSNSLDRRDPDVQTKHLITRPCLSENLGSYYKIALVGTAEQKHWLEAALAFAEINKEPEERYAAGVLRLILRSPQSFLPYEDTGRWRISAQDALKKLAKENQEEITPPKEMQFDTTVPFFFPSLPKILEPIQGLLSFTIPPSGKSLADLIESTVIKREQPRAVPAALTKFLGEKRSVSAVEKAEYERLQTDLTYYQTVKEQIVEMKDKIAFSKTLEDAGEEKRCQELRTSILAMANGIPAENQELQLLKLQGRIKAFTLDALLINFARQKPEALQKNNPSLTKETIETLYSQLGEYLILATQVQQKARVKRALSQNRIDEALSLALAKRAYTIDPKDKKSLTYLTFEYFSDLLLRPEQVSLQATFLENLEDCYAQELIMGSGKSKVILILLALLRADGNKISTVVVASPFFKDVALHTHEILQGKLQQTLATIHFDRGTPLTSDALKTMLETLESVKRNEDCLIITSKSLQCLTLRFIESWIRFTESDQEIPPPELELLQQILIKIYVEGDLLLDELDTILYILHSVSFSMGKKEHPKPALLKINQTIYEILYTDPELKKRGRFESDSRPDPKAPPLTKELYRKEIRSLLAKKFLEKFNSVEINACDQAALIDFICQDPFLEKARIEKAHAAYQSLGEENKEVISQAAMEIGHLLEKTLVRTSKEKYGIPKNALFAIPYEAANVPCIGSDFANHTVIFNYTLQFISKYGLSLFQIKNSIETALARILNDLDGTDNVPNDLLNKWEEKLGVQFSQKKTDWKAIKKKINGDLALKLEFLEDFILPRMEFYSEKITSNSQNIAEIAKRMKGFTGTLFNAKTFHRKFIASPEKGADSKTLSLLFAHSNKPALPFETIGDGWDVWIDAGGYYKEKKNIDLAREIAIRRKMPVLFYHNKVQTVTNGTRETPFKETSLKPGEYLSFLDQVNTTGADTVQKPNAKGYVSIKAGMFRRDLFQAAWRLRGLATGQTIEWVVDKKTASLIRADLNLDSNKPIGLPEILSYCIANEAEQPIAAASLDQIENVKQQLLVKGLLSGDATSQKKALVRSLKSSWCKEEGGLHPSKQFNRIPEMVKKTEYLERYQKPIERQIDGLPISDAAKQAARQEIQEVVKRYQAPGMIPDEIQVPQTNADESVEVEKETHQEIEIEVEIAKEEGLDDVTLEHLTNWHRFTQVKIGKNGAVSFENCSTTRLPLQTYFTSHPKFKGSGIENAFAGIETTLNFLQKDTKDASLIQHYHLYEEYQKEFDYLIFIEGKVLLISQREAIDADVRRYNSIFSLKSGEFLNKEKAELTPQQIQYLLKIRFLAGISSYSDEEIAALETWITAYPKLVDFFKTVVVRRSRLRADEFRGSSLLQLFIKLSHKPPVQAD